MGANPTRSMNVVFLSCSFGAWFRFQFSKCLYGRFFSSMGRTAWFYRHRNPEGHPRDTAVGGRFCFGCPYTFTDPVRVDHRDGHCWVVNDRCRVRDYPYRTHYHTIESSNAFCSRCASPNRHVCPCTSSHPYGHLSRVRRAGASYTDSDGRVGLCPWDRMDSCSDQARGIRPTSTTANVS